MAVWLAEHGRDTAMITWDEGVPAPKEHNGVALYHMCRRDQGIPGLRFVVPRWTSLYRALRAADADVYYYNCGDMGLGQIAAWTRRNRRKLIFSISSDADVQKELPALKTARDRLLYRHGLRHCDAIIAQTNTQRELLEGNFGLPAQVLSMPSAGAGIAMDHRKSEPIRVVWIGRLSREKRPEWFLELADRLPGLNFEMVGGANISTPYARGIVERANSMPNVTVSGRIPHNRMHEVYGRSSILCSTSRFEGFPNIYLEAWSAAIPVVATCDPDGIIHDHGLGFSADSVETLAEAINALAASPERLRAISMAARNYFERKHSTEAAMQAFADFLVGVTQEEPA
jgi:glycosyltransferase involved in cell wall biosynthesis